MDADELLDGVRAARRAKTLDRDLTAQQRAHLASVVDRRVREAVAAGASSRDIAAALDVGLGRAQERVRLPTERNRRRYGPHVHLLGGFAFTGGVVAVALRGDRASDDLPAALNGVRAARRIEKLGGVNRAQMRHIAQVVDRQVFEADAARATRDQLADALGLSVTRARERLRRAQA